jgi:hypothetical protein
LLIGCAAVLLGVPGVLARILTDVAAGATLLRLLRCKRHVRPGADEHGSDKRDEPGFASEHDVSSGRRVETSWMWCVHQDSGILDRCEPTFATTTLGDRWHDNSIG